MPQSLLVQSIGAALAVLCLLAVLARVRARRAREAAGPRPLPGIDGLLRAGDYERAAALALEHGRAGEAIDYFVRAQLPARAAAVAARAGDVRRAAELYERAGDADRAAQLYRQSGLHDRARELAPPPGARADEDAAPADPVARARAAEAAFREAAAAAPGGDRGRVRVQTLARDAAEALLTAGEIRRAAEVFREGDLVDEAIHLYANVLGLPGEAAPLVAARGHHQRAAELYELAGQKERAAAAWADIARAAPRPEAYLDRIEPLSPGVALGLLEDLTAARAPDPETAALYYHLGALLERLGELARALKVFGALRESVGAYRDVDAKLRALRGMHPPAPPAPGPEAPAPPTPPASPAHALTVVVAERDVSPAEAAALAREAARASVDHARRSSIPPPLAAPAATPAVVAVVRPAVRGLEAAPLALPLLGDSAVRAARDGPSVTALRAYIGQDRCALQNIEVFYRLGLAYLAAGQWREAVAAFDAVEEASPGYRDAEARAAQVRAWQQALGPRASGLGRRSPDAAAPGGRYALHGELGRGGMAVVYRATDAVLGREVALKFLSEQSVAQPALRELFQREARSAAQLNHPNVVTIYDFGLLEGRAYISMEYVDGQSVEALVLERGRLAAVEALRIAAQVLDALEYAHARKIIHRDVKPSNMMRTTAGLVKLMDFGLAKSLAASGKSSQVAGTPAYMPLEQYHGGEVDHRADLFAVGASLYEMLTGALPFDGMDRFTRPVLVSARVPALPAVLDRLVLRALEPDPAKRYPSAASFAAAARQILAAADRVATDPGTAAPRPAPRAPTPTLPLGATRA